MPDPRSTLLVPPAPMIWTPAGEDHRPGHAERRLWERLIDTERKLAKANMALAVTETTLTAVHAATAMLSAAVDGEEQQLIRRLVDNALEAVADLMVE